MSVETPVPGPATDPEPEMPRGPIDRITAPIQRFLHVEAGSGVVLLLCAVIALVAANVPGGEGFMAFWKTPVGFQIGSFEMRHSLQHWINDGLMVIFFFVVGLEVKRELVLGELRTARGAALPVAAALGGMIVPAGIYLAFQAGEPGARGWGILMATDIAFVVGCMAVLGSRIPHILRVLLLSLAIVDDIGAILVIAIGYTEQVLITPLALAFAGIGVVFLLQRLGVRNLGVYTGLGILIWLGFHESGVHATIAGVILGLMTPARSHVSTGLFARILELSRDVLQGDGWEGMSRRAERVRAFKHAARETISPLEYLEGTLHPWTSFVIMPIFALANAGVPLSLSGFGEPVALAVMAGLVIGKPLGIVLFSWLAVKLYVKQLPAGISWGAMLGAGWLAGIGFTMALFVASLALEGDLLATAKIGVIEGSLIAAVIGCAILVATLPRPSATDGGSGVRRAVDTNVRETVIKSQIPMRLRDRFESMARAPVLLVMLVLWILLYPLLEDRQVGRYIVATLLVLLLLATVFAVSRNRRAYHWALGISVPTAIACLIYQGSSHPIGLPVANLLLLVFFLYVTSRMLGYVLETGKVTGDKLAASMCVYLLLGMLWTQIYTVLELFAPGSFRSAAEAGKILDGHELIFFSYVTLTTLGYGDITPATTEARSFAIIEATAGVLYVAVLVARLVSLYERDIESSAEEGE